MKSGTGPTLRGMPLPQGTVVGYESEFDQKLRDAGLEHVADHLVARQLLATVEARGRSLAVAFELVAILREISETDRRLIELLDQPGDEMLLRRLLDQNERDRDLALDKLHMQLQADEIE